MTDEAPLKNEPEFPEIMNFEVLSCTKFNTQKQPTRRPDKRIHNQPGKLAPAPIKARVAHIGPNMDGATWAPNGPFGALRTLTQQDT